MPSLAQSSKNNENKVSDPATETPVNQILTIVEHKIRNLEKRKTKLDGYRDLEKKGEKLTSDQKHACKKYEEVIHSLELAKELSKQFSQVAKEANREAKRESKRNAFLRIQQESAKIREVLVIQDILRSLADDSVRQDFLDGTNGAVKIEQADMDLLEKLYVEVTPKRPTRSDEPTFIQSAIHSANTFSSVIDSRPKPFGESTYEHVKETLESIQNCGYFEKDIIQVVETKQSVEDGTEGQGVEGTDAGIDDEEKSSETDPNMVEAPVASAVPQPEGLILSQMPAVPQQLPLPTVQPIPNANVLVSGVPVLPGAPPTVALPVPTVRAVEQTYYKQYMQQQQVPPVAPQPTLRPIHEVIGTGNFHFLQESELDSSDMILTSPYQQQTTKLPPPPPQMIPQQQQQQPQQQPSGTMPPNGTPIVSNVHENANPTIPNASTPQTSSIQAPQSTTFSNQNFPNLSTPTMFNSNVLKSNAGPMLDQPHIPAFTANVSPQIPLQVPGQLPGPFGGAMNGQPNAVATQNAMAQIAQLQSMIQQQQQQQQQQTITKQEINADDLTEKLKSTLHINDNKSNSSNNSTNKINTSVANDVLKGSSMLLNHHHQQSQHQQQHQQHHRSPNNTQSQSKGDNNHDLNAQDWNDMNNDTNSWSNQMASDENNRIGLGPRGSDNKRNSAAGGGNSNNGGSNIVGMFRSDNNKYGAGGNSYRSRNSNSSSSYQNGRTDNNTSSSSSGGGGGGGVFFRNNDRYYQNGSNNKDSYGKPSSGNNVGGGSYKPPRSDMMNNRPPRMQQSGGAPGDYRPSHNRHQSGQPGGRDNRGGLKA